MTGAAGVVTAISHIPTGFQIDAPTQQMFWGRVMNRIIYKEVIFVATAEKAPAVADNKKHTEKTSSAIEM